MLQFLKKTVRNDKNNGKISTKTLICTNNNLPNNVNATTNNKQTNVKWDLQIFEEQILNQNEEANKTKRENSKLSKTLTEALHDKNVLNYLVQFMESRNASAYILCWLDIDVFKSDFTVDQSRFLDEDSLSVSTEAEVDSITADTDSISICGSKNSLASDNSPKLNKSDHVDKFSDIAVSLFKKYIAQEATLSIKCPEDLRKEVVEKICDTNSDSDIFNKVQDYVFNIVDKEYFDLFLLSDFYCKHQIDILTSGRVHLDDILSNETALFYFMEFLDQEDRRNLLEFWIAASNFKEQMSKNCDFYDPLEAQNDAVVLYDKYFSLQAHCPLGFSNAVRFEVEQSICSENGLQLNCFDLPLAVVERALETTYLKPFLGSQLFYKFLSELINTVQSNGYSTNIKKHSRSLSDGGGSERSFASSTFLSIDYAAPCDPPKPRNNMSIDTRELYDPNTLWKRKKQHRLSCGRITELGKFETDFEPEPDRKEFKLKNVVKKLVSLDEEERKREEMAWQVAEMIVKDVTSITLSDSTRNFV